MTSAAVLFLIGVLLLNTGLTVVKRRSLLARLAGDPEQRARFFRSAIAGAWTLALLVALFVLAPADDLVPAGVGWLLTTGGHLGLTPAAGAVLTGLLTVVSIGVSIGAAQNSRRRPDGQPAQIPVEVALLLPRTPQERRLVAGLAVTAGITEEVVYRGFLIGAVITVLGQPPWLAALVSLAIFVGAHACQGRTGMLGVLVIGALFTLLYLLSGSICCGVLVHGVHDLVTLLTAQHPAPPPTAPPPIPVQRLADAAGNRTAAELPVGVRAIRPSAAE